MSITIEVVQTDVLNYRAVVLALKFTQDLYGVHTNALWRLVRKGTDVDTRLPAIGESLLISSERVVASHELLFIGVQPPGQFDYGRVRELSRHVFSVLANQRPGTEHVAMTLYGRGLGLDEAEAFRAQIAGVLDAINDRLVPARLRQVSIGEMDPEAAERMQALLTTIIPPGSSIGIAVPGSQSAFRDARAGLESVGPDSRTKPLGFVAMPFADELSDRFHFGIEGAVYLVRGILTGFFCRAKLNDLA